jgi:GNAT superfamily N-acetyltransferase
MPGSTASANLSGDGFRSRCEDLLVQVRALTDAERGWLVDRLLERWGSVGIARLGELRDASVLPALVAVSDAGERVGVLTYEVVGDQLEVMSLDAFTEGAGVGTALLAAVAQIGLRAGCRRLWLITTNDNMRALHFYQRRGLRLVALYPGVVEAARRLKPSIPLVAGNGIEIRDEIELERGLA